MLYANAYEVMMLNDDNHTCSDDAADDFAFAFLASLGFGQGIFGECSAHDTHTLDCPLDFEACVPTLYTYSRGRKIKSFKHVIMALNVQSTCYYVFGSRCQCISWAHLISSVCFAQTFQNEINIFQRCFISMYLYTNTVYGIQISVRGR